MTLPPQLRFTTRFYLFAALVSAAFLAGTTCGKRTAPSPDNAVTRAETVHVQAMAHTDTVRAEVTRWLTRWRTDTLRVTDTFTVRDTLYRIVNASAFDSTLRACQLLSDAVVGERSACAASKQALRDSIGRLQPRFRDRFGITVGYGVTASPNGDVSHGVQVGASVKVWP